MTVQHISADGERFIATTKSFLLPPTNNATATSQHGNLPCLYLEVQWQQIPTCGSTADGVVAESAWPPTFMGEGCLEPICPPGGCTGGYVWVLGLRAELEQLCLGREIHAGLKENIPLRG